MNILHDELVHCVPYQLTVDGYTQVGNLGTVFKVNVFTDDPCTIVNQAIHPQVVCHLMERLRIVVKIETYFQHTLQFLCIYVEIDFTGNHVGNTNADILLLEVQHHHVFALSPKEPLKELALAGQYQFVALDLEH